MRLEWPDMLTFSGSLDGFLRLLIVAVVGILLVFYSTVFEVEYSTKLVELYLLPWWRLLVTLLILVGAIWCPRVAIVVATLVFFYFADMHTLLSPLAQNVQMATE
jgi:hypothetical protein